MDLWDMFLNILFISIPEEFFITIIALIIMRRTDFLDKACWKENLFRVMAIVVIPCAIIFNLTLEFLGTTYNMPVNIVFFTICLCFLMDTKKFFKVLFFACISTLLLMITQFITAFVLVVVLKKDFSLIGSNVLTNIKIFMPERFAQFSVLCILVMKNNSTDKKNIIKIAYNNRALRKIVMATSLINITLFLVIMKSFIIDRSLNFVAIDQQIIIIASTLCLIILNMSIPWIIAFCVYSSENKYKNIKEEIR